VGGIEMIVFFVVAYAKILGERNGKGLFGTLKSCGRYRKRII